MSSQVRDVLYIIHIVHLKLQWLHLFKVVVQCEGLGKLQKANVTVIRENTRMMSTEIIIDLYT